MTREQLIDWLLGYQLGQLQDDKKAMMYFIQDVLANGFISYFDRDTDQLQDLYDYLQDYPIKGANHE